MVESNEQSYVELAETILKSRKEPIDLYDLFDLVLESKGVKEFSGDTLNAFYANITSSAKFIYMGNNTWDLKHHQKIELWEKDGSYYHEYKEVQDDVLDARIIEQAEEEKRHLAMLEQRKAKAIEAEAKAIAEAELAAEDSAAESTKDQEELIEDAIEFEMITPDEEIEPDTEKTDEKPKEKTDDDAEYSEEDEEEYNKYMDMYEDEYDK